MTADELRERIEATLRARYATDNVSVLLGPAPDGFRGYDAAVPVIGGYVAARADDEATALRGLARIVGLDADGTDPRAELAAAHKRSAIEAMQRRALCNEGNRLGEQLGWANSRAVHAELEVERIRRELAEARALLNGGRTPTDAQIAAHEGKWLIVKDHSSGYAASAVGEERALETARYEREHPGSGYVWHAIDEASGAIVPPPKGQ